MKTLLISWWSTTVVIKIITVTANFSVINNALSMCTKLLLSFLFLFFSCSWIIGHNQYPLKQNWNYLIIFEFIKGFIMINTSHSPLLELKIKRRIYLSCFAFLHNLGHFAFMLDCVRVLICFLAAQIPLMMATPVSTAKIWCILLHSFSFSLFLRILIGLIYKFYEDASLETCLF